MHTYIHTYIHTCMHACMHTYIHTYSYIVAYTHAATCSYMQTHARCMHTYVHTVSYMSYIVIQTYIHKYIHTMLCYATLRYVEIYMVHHIYMLNRHAAKRYMARRDVTLYDMRYVMLHFKPLYSCRSCFITLRYIQLYSSEADRHAASASGGVE